MKGDAAQMVPRRSRFFGGFDFHRPELDVALEKERCKAAL